MPQVRPYLFYDTAVSVCQECLDRVEAKVLIIGDEVFLEKWCPTHGKSRVLISTDANYYRMCREIYIKPPEMPFHFNTPMKFGCPYDCGICPDHMQHSCLTILEVTDHCNLSCPICYAASGPDRKSYRDLATIERMLDAIVRNEGTPDVVQISGGEPTLHPEFFEILTLAKARPIRHLMINTNGIRIAQDFEFASRIADYGAGTEIYLQFDSLKNDRLKELRGANLLDVRLRALENLNRLDLSTTLVVTLKKGCNDEEVGAIIDFALKQPCVRGVTFQPIQHAGRSEGFDSAKNRLTLTEVRQSILTQSQIFSEQDIIPVPCNPDCLAMGYALKLDSQVFPLTRFVPPEVLIGSERNTIVFESDQAVRDGVFKLFATNHSPESSASTLKDLLCCLPQIEVPEKVSYKNVFRVIIMQFLDAWSFDLRAVKKSCVHIARPDGKIIPFDTFNLFYRDELSAILEQKRSAILKGRNQEGGT